MSSFVFNMENKNKHINDLVKSKGYKKDAWKVRPKVLYNFIWGEVYKKDEDSIYFIDKKSDVIKRMSEGLKITPKACEASISLAKILDLVKEKNEYLIIRVSKYLI